MSVGPGPRWVPFPVQDWARLPADEWPGEPTAATPVPPTPAGRLVPWVAVLLTLVLVAGTFVVADRAASRTGPAPTGAAAYLPPDGQVSYGTRRIQTRRSDTSVTEVREVATYRGPQLQSALDVTLAEEVLAPYDVEERVRARFLRTTTSVVGEQAAQRVEVWRTDGAVTLLAREDTVDRQVFAPGLELLPADVTAGSRWSSAGTTGDGSYAADLAATAGPGDCLRVEGRLTLTRRGAARVEELSQTWCRGRGLQAAVTGVGTGAEATRITRTVQPVTRLTDLVPGVAPETAAPTWAWRPDRWTEHRYDVSSVDPRLGARPMADTPAPVGPAVTSSGLLFRAGVGSRDVYALTPRTADGWRTLWRLHPGGTVLSVTAFGDVVVIATSARTLVGYDAAGVRLWTHDAGELTSRPPVRVGPDRIATVTVDGRLTLLDLRSGRPGWSVEVGQDVGAAPAVVGGSGGTGSVVTVGRDGTVAAWAVADGSPRWTLAGLGPTSVVALGTDRMLVADGVDLDAVDVATGERLWRRPVRDTVTAVAPLGRQVVVATRAGTVVLDRDGRVATRLPAYRQLSSDDAADGPTTVGWGARQADVLAADGAVRAGFPTGGAGLTTSPTSLAYRQGVWLFDSTWRFRGWSDEP